MRKILNKFQDEICVILIILHPGGGRHKFVSQNVKYGPGYIQNPYSGKKSNIQLQLEKTIQYTC